MPPLTTADVVYADYQAAKPVDPRVVAAMLPYFSTTFANAASLHALGDEATVALEDARARIATVFGAQPAEIVFTSGATEANNLGIIGYMQRNRRKGDHVVITEAEHISVLNIAKYLEKNGFRVSRCPIDLNGRVSLKKLRARITDDTILVSVGWASSEIGTIQPIAEIADMLSGTGVAIHTDAVAAEGLVPIDMSVVPVSLMSLSANDIYGPRGLGVLYVRKGVQVAPVMFGGGQERGLRSGTEDVAAIVGMAVAGEIMAAEMPTEVARIQAIRDRLVERVLTGKGIDVGDVRFFFRRGERRDSRLEERIRGRESFPQGAEAHHEVRARLECVDPFLRGRCVALPSARAEAQPQEALLRDLDEGAVRRAAVRDEGRVPGAEKAGFRDEMLHAPLRSRLLV